MFLALCALGLAISPSPLEIRGDYPILQDVFVNGKGPFRMLVDTGAQSTSVRPSVARLAGLRPSFAIELHNTLSVGRVPGTRADRVASGDVEIGGVEVLITEPPSLPGMGALDGVIGQSFLGRTNYWMDYARRHMHWDPDGALAGCLDGERLEFALVDGRPALRARVTGGGRDERRLVLDSGASHLIMFGWQGADGGAATASVRTAQNRGTARLVRVGSMAVGGLSWRGLTAGVLEMNDAVAGGLFPARLLKSFYVNNRERYVLAAPRASARCASGPTGPLARRGESIGKAW